MPIPPIQIADVTVAPAPRQSPRDKWEPRPCVLRYRESSDRLRALGLRVPQRFVMVFYRAMPVSWSAARRAERNGAPHRVKPDADNLVKSALDALVPDDAGHWDERGVTLWAYRARLLIIDPTQVTVDDALLRAHLPAVDDSTREGEG